MRGMAIQPLLYTDATGRAWYVYDYCVSGSGPAAKKTAVPLGAPSAQARAFVPVKRPGAVLIYTFGSISFHVATRHALASQFRSAQPRATPTAERAQGR